MSPAERSTGFFAGLVRRPITLLVVFATLIVVGVIAYGRIPVQMWPSGVALPQLVVWVSHPGSSAHENDRKVTRVLEEQLRTLSGVAALYSSSGPDTARVRGELDADQDMGLAKAEVRDRIERARALLPDTVDRIGIWSFNIDQMPILMAAVLTPPESDRTDFLLDTVVQRRLEAVDGVGRADIHGVLDDSVRILLDEDRVRAANLDLGRLIGRLASDNFALPMGEVLDGGRRVLLRADMRFDSLEEIRNYPVGGGLVIGDLGTVARVKSVRERLVRVDGRQAYVCQIQKDSQANTVATSRRVREAFDDLRLDAELAGDFEFLPFFDQGLIIESSLTQLRETAMWGGGLALVVLLVFLRRIRLMLAVAASIPVSALLAIAWAFFSGGSFNIMTMVGITLAMGMLVDNSVVVIESISRRRMAGEGKHAAASGGTAEVGLAVALATLTTVVAFLPLIFMSENPFLRVVLTEIGLPLCISLLSSLMVALVFLPVIAARIVGRAGGARGKLAQRLAPVGRLPARLASLAVGALSFARYHAARVAQRGERGLLRALSPLRWLLAAGVVGLVWHQSNATREALGVAEELQPLGVLPRASYFGIPLPAGLDAWIPVMYWVPGALLVLLLLFGVGRWRRRPPGEPRRPARWIPRASSIMDLVVASNRGLLSWSLEHRLLASALAALAVLSVMVPLGRMEITPFLQDEDGGQIQVYVELEANFTLQEAAAEMARYEEHFSALREDYGFVNLVCDFRESGGEVSMYWEARQDPEYLEELRRRVREEVPRYPGHSIRMRGEGSEEGRSKTVVAFRLHGPDSEELERIGQHAEEILKGVPGLTGITSRLQSSPEQLRVVMDPEVASARGVTADATLRNISWALRGWQLPRYQEPGREVPLIIEYDEEEVAGLNTLKDLQVFTGASAVPLSSFAKLEFMRGSRWIYRRNGKTSYTIVGEVDGPLQQKAVSEAGHAALAAGLELPRGYEIGEEGLLSRRQQEELFEMARAFLLSVTLAFLLMGILFESFLLPFSVLFTIPFAIAGACWTLYVSGTTMDTVGWFGVIILAGVVVNNGIVLLDRVHRLRVGGMDRARAVLEGSAQRVRPILMTALTTVCGLLPMALAPPPSQGIDYRALATCVAGGLAISTFFTLWVVPLAYTLLDDLSTALIGRVRWAFRPPARVRSRVG